MRCNGGVTAGYLLEGMPTVPIRVETNKNEERDACRSPKAMEPTAKGSGDPARHESVCRDVRRHKIVGNNRKAFATANVEFAL